MRSKNVQIRRSRSKIQNLIFLILVLFASSNLAAASTGDKHRTTNAVRNAQLWSEVVGEMPSGRVRPQMTEERYRVFRLNRAVLDDRISQMPLEFTEDALQRTVVLEVPMPDGKLSRFRVELSPMLAPNIAAEFPTWRQFSGQGIDDPTAVARFDVNGLGFHGYILSSTGTVLIDPYSLTDQKNYIVYYKGDIGDSDRDGFACKWKEELKWKNGDFPSAPEAFSHGTQLRTFRLAVSATKEYTNFFGGNTATAFAAVQTTVNRMITIYRRDLATTFTLVTGVGHVFTNANNGGFPDATNPMVSDLSLPRNQIVMDTGNTANPGNPGPVGTANYDIGHVLSRTGNPNGLASSPSLCDPAGKAQGFTGAPTPQGDGFDVDYVAHEIGHQFGMSHTFNNNADGSCSSRSATSAYEPASGVTIMGYGGICAPRNLSATSIEYFNLRSFDQSLEWFQSILMGVNNTDPACGMPTNNGNAAPIFLAPPGNFTIPRLTPFTLTAAATDANGDTITYLWEEFDLGAATNSAAQLDDDAVGGARPILRAYNASTSGSRTFPTMNYILNPAGNEPAGSNQPSLTYTGTLPNAPGVGSTNGYVCAPTETCTRGERLPNITRSMVFRVIARDNRAGSGGTADATSTVAVAGSAGPFSVTTINSAADYGIGTTWAAGSTQTVTWDVAGTTANGINTANVKISLSTDGGQTFPITILASTPNDGTESITVPNNATTQARIKVEAVGNIFFDINNVNFTITAAAGRARADFDADGKTDLSVFRPSEGNWYLNRSTSGFTVTRFGLNTDVIVPADYDGDRRTDFAVWRPSNVEGQPDFYLLRSTDSTFSGIAWGTTSDTPVVADYDGDGKADFAIWRPASGDFYVRQSQSGGLRYYRFGVTGDKPVSADYDGDGKADFAVFRPSNGNWYIARSIDNVAVTSNWGVSTDIPVFADYDGDSKDDIAVFRPSNGFWYILRSTGGTSYIPFGTNGDIPVPGDYDGDGKNDQAVYRAGTWYLNRSTSGFSAQVFGLATDTSVPSAYHP